MRRRGFLGLLQTLAVLFLLLGPHAAPVVRAMAAGATEVEVESEHPDDDSAIVTHGRRVPGGSDRGKSSFLTRAASPRTGPRRSIQDLEPNAFLLPKSRFFWIWAWSQTWHLRAR